ncbi:MAG: winged helix-turn-helix domain-containing protein [Paracoccaceae bacterium]
MARLLLDNRTARSLFLDRHALAEAPAGPGKGADLEQLIHRLGFVQLDSINTVARAHDLILFARRPAYRPRNLQLLYERDRKLFEHWTHDAAVIPMAFYPHWQLRFRRDEEMLRKRWRNWRRDGFESRFQSVLTHIRDQGPVCSSDVGTDEKKSSGGWWDWHPSKTALEYLWRSGALTVVGRSGFRKFYDLTERVIEAQVHADRPEDHETINWCCNAALDRLGFATSGELAAFWDTVSAAEAKEWCARELEQGRLIEVEIETVDQAPRRCFARPGIEVETPPEPTGRLRVLSPFDPALRDRNRAERLFGFHYRIEVFTPAAKRRYGYYVFPLMERDRLVGRVDMKAHRDQDQLRITALWPERNVKWTAGRARRFEAELDRIRRLAGVQTVVFEDDWLREA